MEFDLTADQVALVESARRLALDIFGQARSRRDIGAGMSRDSLRRLARNGFGGLMLPEAEGGQGASILDTVLVLETMAAVNPAAGDAVQALNFGAIQQLARLASSETRALYLPRALSAEVVVALAITEPGAGSSVTELSTKASVSEDTVRVTGSKIFTTNAADADLFVVWVRFGSEKRSLGAVLVERETPGLYVDTSNSFISGERYGVLHLEDCQLPTRNILVREDIIRQGLSIFNIERLGNAARALALGQTALSLSTAHASDRKQFGHTLLEFQGLEWKLAEVALALEAGRLLLYRAAAHGDVALPSATETSMAKLACNRAGFQAADAAVQILGGQGYDSESLAGYLFQRTRGWMIAGGTIEQMLNRLAADLPGLAASVKGGVR